jgi:hypothetical protein
MYGRFPLLPETSLHRLLQCRQVNPHYACGRSCAQFGSKPYTHL